MNKALSYSIVASAVMLFMQSDAIAAECANRLSGKSTVSAILFCMVEMNREIEGLRTSVNRRPEPAVPSGAVIAFDRAGKCPNGWTVSSQTAGRIIIGVGQGNTDENKQLLTERIYLEQGGVESVTLTEAQMPAHNHSVPFVMEVSNLSGGSFPVMSDQRHRSPATGSVNTSSAGSSQPHNNMPPLHRVVFLQEGLTPHSALRAFAAETVPRTVSKTPLTLQERLAPTPPTNTRPDCRQQAK